MATADSHSGVTLRLERTYKASPERVFDAWVRAEAVAEWFAPSKDFATVVTELDAQPGGRYRVEMRDPSGAAHVVGGVYQELTRPTTLAMTWAWEGQEEFGLSLVTVQLSPDGTGTRLVLLHQQLPSDAARAEHEKGWTGCLGRLEPFLLTAR